MPKPIETLQLEVRDIQKQLKELITSVAELKIILNPPIIVDDEDKCLEKEVSGGWFF
tara:strand:+ start:1764 stop:1934 length:171 start_codon:yes stop_codon:yes gene_type:complete